MRVKQRKRHVAAVHMSSLTVFVAIIINRLYFNEIQIHPKLLDLGHALKMISYNNFLEIKSIKFSTLLSKNNSFLYLNLYF